MARAEGLRDISGKHTGSDHSLESLDFPVAPGQGPRIRKPPGSRLTAERASGPWSPPGSPPRAVPLARHLSPDRFRVREGLRRSDPHLASQRHLHHPGSPGERPRPPPPAGSGEGRLPGPLHRTGSLPGRRWVAERGGASSPGRGSSPGAPLRSPRDGAEDGAAPGGNRPCTGGGIPSAVRARTRMGQVTPGVRCPGFRKDPPFRGKAGVPDLGGEEGELGAA